MIQGRIQCASFLMCMITAYVSARGALRVTVKSTTSSEIPEQEQSSWVTKQFNKPKWNRRDQTLDTAGKSLKTSLKKIQSSARTPEEANYQCTIEAKKFCDEKVADLPLEHTKLGSYYFNMDENVKLTWFGASDFCLKHGMHLVVMETPEENEFIVSRVENEVSGDNAGFWNFFWVGLNDLENEGQFKWSGLGDDVKYTNWNFEEPNNFEDDENCGSICKFNGLGWNDLNCTVPGRFICEIEEPCKSLLQM